MNNPDISIVIPTLNEEGYLDLSLESILKQKTNLKYEIIIADGYSKDKTREIAESYGARTILVQAGSIALGRKTGCEEATGKIIVSANADAEYSSKWLDNISKPIREKSAIATIGKIVPLEGNALEEFTSNHVLNNLTKVSLAMKIPYAYAENMAFLKEIYLKAGGFNENMKTGEDTDLAKRLLEYGNVKYCPDAVGRMSMRRVRKWGYLKFVTFHTKNFIDIQMNNGHAKEYEPIR